MKVKVNLKKLNENAKLPIKKHDEDFCYDVYAVSEEEIAPNIWRYGLGFSYEIDRESFENVFKEFKVTCRNKVCEVPYFNIDIQFVPRSSVWETGMILSNCEGQLDEYYRGEAMAVYYHIFPNMPRYKVGDRIGQIKLGITIPMEFEFVDEINENTNRGKGGFGSTGKN